MEGSNRVGTKRVGSNTTTAALLPLPLLLLPPPPMLLVLLVPLLLCCRCCLCCLLVPVLPCCRAGDVVRSSQNSCGEGVDRIRASWFMRCGQSRKSKSDGYNQVMALAWWLWRGSLKHEIHEIA
jgi:hypothetical protein